MDKFGSLQGRVYELGGVSGAISALRSFKLSDLAEDQIERITARLGRFSLTKIFRQSHKEADIRSSFANKANPMLTARLFQGYVQGFCETKQFIRSLPCKWPKIAWVYANPILDDTGGDVLALARQELFRIADLSDFDFTTLSDTGKCPRADFLFIVQGYNNDAYRFHLAAYELSAHTAPLIDDELNLSVPDDVCESLRRGKSMMTNAIRTRDYQIASETLGLEISRELRNYFRGLLTHDKITKKLFQGGGYLFSLYDTIKDRILPEKPFDKWKAGQGNIEFHIVAFTERARHFLHLRESEAELLREMGEIYKGIRHGSARTSQEARMLREREIFRTNEAVLRNIRRNSPSDLQNALKTLSERAVQTFSGRRALPEYLNHAFTEKIEGYAPTGSPPSREQLEAWLPPELAERLRNKELRSMQDAHAEMVMDAWEKADADLYVLSGTPGIGKTTALRNILADYEQGYLLVYISPRIQVNTDLIAKFDPTDENNRLMGKAEMICITSNSALINAAEHHHGKPALICASREIPEDAKFLFLKPEDAEELETFFSRDRTALRALEKGRLGELGKYFTSGVFKTNMQAIRRLNVQHRYKRIIACVSTQSNLQLAHNETTFSAHLKKIFTRGRKLDPGSVEKFSKNIREVIFFIDEVTGDRAGRQAAQEIINFRKELERMFREIGRPFPLRFRILIADASLINASSVETFLNRKTSHPDQILFNGNADRKGLSIEEAKIMGLHAKIINANVFPASSLRVKWRPVLDFSTTRGRGERDHPVVKAYAGLEIRIMGTLAGELLDRWRKRPEEQSIVIIQNRASIETLKGMILSRFGQNRENRPDIICLHSHSPPWVKRDIVSPASDEEKTRKKRVAGISQKGDMADIILMTSSGTRGISFPNASKIICVIPTFSLENNFMEFLQGIYRGRGGGKGNRLEREIEMIIPQILAAPPEDSQASRAFQISNLFATQMILRMSIFTRIFGACDLFGKSVSCIPISGSLVRGASQTIMDSADSAITSLGYAQKRDPKNVDLRYIKENVRDIFKNETVVLQSTYHSDILVSETCRNRLLKAFIQDANRGLHVIASGDYIPRECYTVGELFLQNLSRLNIKEKNRYIVETHLEKKRRKMKAICAKLNQLIKDKDTVKSVRDPANSLYPILSKLVDESESDMESETTGSGLNRWLITPISGMCIREFWKGQVEPDVFKGEMKAMLREYIGAYLCNPHNILPLHHNYGDKIPPWLLVRGPEIQQRLDSQFQTRYFVSSKYLALLNIMLLGKKAGET
ncbi:hypothetical protein QUF72_20495 [Desulfobacterales bacterium HSG2]|nr:hypothetical protein [Desulfobacterales bacterium HSG2]